jgi:hypothetical protein
MKGRRWKPITRWCSGRAVGEMRERISVWVITQRAFILVRMSSTNVTNVVQGLRATEGGGRVATASLVTWESVVAQEEVKPVVSSLMAGCRRLWT